MKSANQILILLLHNLKDTVKFGDVSLILLTLQEKKNSFDAGSLSYNIRILTLLTKGILRFIETSFWSYRISVLRRTGAHCN